MTTNLFDLSGKVALVTGGGRGMGRFICETLAEYGADIVTCGRTKEKLDETVELLKKYGHRALAIQADVTKEDSLKAMVNEIVGKFGKIDILFNNAGTLPVDSPLHEISLESWEETMNTDLKGVFLTMKAVIPVMLQQKSGNIINISSITGLKTLDRELAPLAGYFTAKAGVDILTKQAASEYASLGIRVNSIAPGRIRPTALSAERKKRWSPERVAQLEAARLNRIPIKRFGAIGDLKGAIIYLASDASSFVVGHTLVVDGGETI
jgi:NAD(P)-dependent dehydrogenase (short-subunit alcohol dehydrogenase family)